MSETNKIVYGTGGVELTAPVVPATGNDNPTHYAEYGKGGWHSVGTKEELNNIPTARLEIGMATLVQDENKAYILTSIGDNGIGVWENLTDELQMKLEADITELRDIVIEDEEVTAAALNQIHGELGELGNTVEGNKEEILNQIHLKIGTSEERLAYAAYEGLQWNDVNGSGEIITRWLYTMGEWRQIEIPQLSPVETIYLHVIKTGGNLVLAGILVGVHDDTTNEALGNITLDENGQAMFTIPKGNTYTITMPNQAGYVNIQSTTFTAAIDQHMITLAYRSVSVPENPYEQVKFRVCAYNINLTNTESLQDEFIGTSVSMVVKDAASGATTTFTATIDNTHTATFDDPVKWGDSYTITVPPKEGFTILWDNTVTRTASQATSVIVGYYIETPGQGLLLVDTDWKMYDYETLNNKKENGETLPTCLGFYINTSTLQEHNASFFIQGLRYNMSKGAQWMLPQNLEIDRNELPFKNTLALASVDFDGPGNTDKIITIGGSMSVVIDGKDTPVTTPAATYCRQQTITRPQIDENGNPILDENGDPRVNTYVGYLPSFGELWQLHSVGDEIVKIQLLYDNKFTNINNGVWWSSTQYSSTDAVTLHHGRFNYGYGKTPSHTALPLFRPF